MDALIHLANFPAVIQWVLEHSYFVILVAMLIEGPIVTAAAAFCAALGYFNLSIVFILSIFGDLIADVVYYLIGYWGRMTLVERFGAKVGLTRERLERMASLLNEHAWKTLLALKLTPILPPPGLMLVGAIKMPLRKYATICTLIILPKSLIFMIIGYYFGQAYGTIAHYIKDGTYIIFAIIGIIILINYFYIKYSGRLGRAIEKF